MMQPWGHTFVSSAHEVYLLLSRLPADAEDANRKDDLISIEPPVWGSSAACESARVVAACGYRVWSWDELGIVYSYPHTLAPRSLRYMAWSEVGQAASIPQDKPP
jgi:hypothetical protein